MRTVMRFVNRVGRFRRLVSTVGWLLSVLPVVCSGLVGVRGWLVERDSLLASSPELVEGLSVGAVVGFVPVWVWVVVGVFSGLGVVLLVAGFMSHTGTGKGKGEGGVEATTSATVGDGSTGDTPTPPMFDDDGDDDYGLGEV